MPCHSITLMSHEIHIILPADTPRATLDDALTLLPETAIRPRVGIFRSRYGLVPYQPMLTWRFPGTEVRVVEHFHAMLAKLKTRVTVLRGKIESLMSDAPEILPSHEHYWEVLNTGGDDWDTIAAVCAPHGAHLSWNDAKRGTAVPIVTLRRYAPVTKTDAEAAMARVEADLRRGGYALGELQREHCILDLNPSLDEGWLYPHGAAKTELLQRVPTE